MKRSVLFVALAFAASALGCDINFNGPDDDDSAGDTDGDDDDDDDDGDDDDDSADGGTDGGDDDDDDAADDGSGDGGDDDDDDDDDDATDDGGNMTCQDGPDCQSCFDCESDPGGTCEDLLIACAAIDDCLDIAPCYDDCTLTAIDQTDFDICFGACVELFPEGAQEFVDWINCGFDECSDLCQ